LTCKQNYYSAGQILHSVLHGGLEVAIMGEGLKQEGSGRLETLKRDALRNGHRLLLSASQDCDTNRLVWGIFREVSTFVTFFSFSDSLVF
jgi:hypothetical protein